MFSPPWFCCSSYLKDISPSCWIGLLFCNFSEFYFNLLLIIIIVDIYVVQICRSVHISAYDKNHEEIVQPNVVPDHVIPPHNEKYWAPHPQTGVFGPTTDGKFDVHATATSEDSVLEQKTFIRPLEDLDKPPVQP